jgi:predicted AAA+ superfamily ATPase
MTAPIAKLFPRFAADRVSTALQDTPVVMVNGPRQCGKTTLVREFTSRNRTYITLDDDTVLEAVRDDPSGFVRALNMAIVDEFQRAPEYCAPLRSPSTPTSNRTGQQLPG